MPQRSKRHRIIVSKHLVSKKLILRLRMFALIFLIMMAIIINDIVENIIGVPLVILGTALGLVAGFTRGHLANLNWHPETEKVVAKMDKTGVIVLILYLCFSFSRKWIFGHWIHGPALSAFCFSIVAGVMFGRLFSTRHQIKDILKDQGHL